MLQYLLSLRKGRPLSSKLHWLRNPYSSDSCSHNSLGTLHCKVMGNILQKPVRGLQRFPFPAEWFCQWAAGSDFIGALLPCLVGQWRKEGNSPSWQHWGCSPEAQAKSIWAHCRSVQIKLRHCLKKSGSNFSYKTAGKRVSQLYWKGYAQHLNPRDHFRHEI